MVEFYLLKKRDLGFMADKLKRNLFTAAMAVFMVILAEVLGESEIVFPEIVALLIGMWLTDKQPWIVSKPMLVTTISLSAIVGICIVRYFHVHMLIQLAVAFIYIAAAMIISRSTFAPMISACLLPILIRTESIIYPVSVLIMSTILVLVRIWLEHMKLVERVQTIHCELKLRSELIKWLGLFAVYMLVAAIPVIIGNYYFIAPPLVVIFVSISSKGSPLRKMPVKIVLLSAAAALIGILSRYCFVELLSLPLTVAALVSIVLLLIILQVTGVYLPPLGALLYLPLILPSEGLWLYPLEVTVGAAVFTACGMLLWNRRA